MRSLPASSEINRYSWGEDVPQPTFRVSPMAQDMLLHEAHNKPREAERIVCDE
jgi:hypothetical protein